MTTATSTVAPGTYRIDTTRSTVRFATRGMFGLHPVRGAFTVRDGTVVVAADLHRSRVEASVDAASFDSANARRDSDIRSKRFLDVARYPEMAFTSTRASTSAIEGRLTVHGVTAPVTFALSGAHATADGFTCTATARVDRYAFGVTRGKGLVARYVDVTMEIIAG